MRRGGIGFEGGEGGRERAEVYLDNYAILRLRMIEVCQSSRVLTSSRGSCTRSFRRCFKRAPFSPPAMTIVETTGQHELRHILVLTLRGRAQQTPHVHGITGG